MRPASALVPALIGLLAAACGPGIASQGAGVPEPVRLEQLQGDFVCNGGGVVFRLTIGPGNTYRDLAIGRWESPGKFVHYDSCFTGSAAVRDGKLVLSGGVPCDYDGDACIAPSGVILDIQRADARGFATPSVSCERKRVNE
jgi:hypothetical protein